MAGNRAALPPSRSRSARWLNTRWKKLDASAPSGGPVAVAVAVAVAVVVARKRKGVEGRGRDTAPRGVPWDGLSLLLLLLLLLWLSLSL